MSETPQAKAEELSLKEVASFALDLNDRLTKIEKSGTNGAAVEEQLRAYRLLKMENQSAQNFAAGFFNRAEPLMDKLSGLVESSVQKIKDTVAYALDEIRKAAQQATGDKKLMLKVQDDAQQVLNEVQNKLTELETAQADTRTMQNSTIQRWNEQTKQITTANVERAAGAAAKEAFDAMTKEVIKEEVARQVRVALGNK